VRDRSGLPAGERRIEYVPEVELVAALRRVIAGAYGIDGQECGRRVLNLLGFRAAHEKGLSRVQQALQGLIDAGEVAVRDGRLWC